MSIERARIWVGQSHRIVVLTGAGISTDSGIPDYRGPNGEWTRNPNNEKRAHIDMWRNDTAFRAAEWQKYLRQSQPEPNSGHYAVARLARTGRMSLLVTMNIDGLHQRAGHDADQTVEIHGHKREAACLQCGWRMPMRAALAQIQTWQPEPSCQHCDGIMKPAVVSFGQRLNTADWERCCAAADACDLFIAVGTTLLVPPACTLLPRARDFAHARTIIIGDGETLMDDTVDLILRGSISELLSHLI